ncbi:tail sheath protein [Edwardsiella phage vB_EtaM_ET-ABTNL-9]|nr:tail sheath protein [Edwardsiella phage vB_EtaM_ET-ABTNL-9]
MLEIKDIVNVVINRETTSKTVRDLKTIAVLSKHNLYGESEAYREYSSTTAMLDDGFLTADFAYVAAQRIFSQNPQVASIVVGKVSGTDSVDYVKEITELQAANNDWFFLITDAKDKADKLAIAKYIESQTAVYVFSDSDAKVLTPEDKTDVFSEMRDASYMQSFGMFVKDSKVVAPEAAWVGRFASAVIGSNTWIHKALAGLTPENLTRTEMSTLKKKNAHFYTLVGQDPSIEGNANVSGGEKIHVILGAIWLKVRLAERTWNILYTKGRLNYTNSSIEIFKAEIVNVLNEAVNLNILTNDEGFNIQVPDANRLTSSERADGYLRKITFRARLAGAILFVDSIEGTVYA